MKVRGICGIILRVTDPSDGASRWYTAGELCRDFGCSFETLAFVNSEIEVAYHVTKP